CALPKFVHDRADGVRLLFKEAHGHAPPDAEIRTRITSLPRPQFAYALQVSDAEKGNGNGVVERGETATIHLKVRNVGRGQGHKTQANLRNMSGRGILLRDGRFQLDNLKPGEERDIAFTFESLPDSDQSEVKLGISITDIDLREVVNETLKLPIKEPQGDAIRKGSGTVSLRDGAVIRERPDTTSKSVARCTGGRCSLPVRAHFRGFTRVETGDGRQGWIHDAQAAGAHGRTRGSVAADLNHMPPRLDVDYGHTLVTRRPTLRLRGRATDETRVRDMYVFVGARKVFYRANSGLKSPRAADFETEIPLRGGINYVTVFARESNDIVSRKTFVVRRDGPDGSLLETPKLDDETYWLDDVAE
ncbi:MAG: hypothetical protein MJD61_01775, partial [Proteobacteria bacterium]|nr:hypothetical protein [Pseudomonadota bacterium]